jgi:hypothetical protein
VMPAQQCLKADDLVRDQIDLRLVYPDSEKIRSPPMRIA